MQWQGRLDLGRPITLNGKPHGVEYVDVKPEYTSIYLGQVIFVETENKVYIGTSSGFTELTPNSQSHNHNDIYYVKSEIDSIMSPVSGHDHNGIDSKKLSFNNLVDVPIKFSPLYHGNESHDASYITASQVNYSLFTTNGLIGNNIGQISSGNHNHDDIYSKKLDLSGTSGATLVGVSAIGSSTNTQEALTYLNNNFNNYYNKSSTYSISESDDNFISAIYDQQVSGIKLFSSSVGIKTSSTNAPLEVSSDSNLRHIFVGDSFSTQIKDNVLIDGYRNFSGDLTSRKIYGFSSDIKFSNLDLSSPASVCSSSNVLEFNGSFNSSSDISSSTSVINKTGSGTLPNVSVLKSVFTSSNDSLETSNVKLLDLRSSFGLNTNTNNLYSIYVKSSENPNVIQNNYGIYVEDVDANLSKYSIYTNSGEIRFGDKITSNNIEAETVNSTIGFNNPYKSISALEFKLSTQKSLLLNGENISINNNSVINKIMTDLDTYTKTEVDNSLLLKANSSETYTKTDLYTKAEVDNSLLAKADISETYTKVDLYTKTNLYTKTEIDNSLLLKANSSETYAKTDLYTKTEVDNSLLLKANSSETYTKTDLYTKTEVDAVFNSLSWREPVNSSEERDLLLNSTSGDIVLVLNENKLFSYNGSSWIELIKTTSSSVSYSNVLSEYNGNVKIALDSLISEINNLKNRIVELENNTNSIVTNVYSGGSASDSSIVDDQISGGDSFTDYTNALIIDGGKA